MKRRFIPFDDNYRVPVDVRVSCGVVCNGALFTCGQMDLDRRGVPRNVANLWGQTDAAMRLLFKVIEKAEFDTANLLQVHVFYRTEIDEEAYAKRIRASFPQCSKSVLVLTPVRSFPSKGAEVEIDAIVVSAQDSSCASFSGELCTGLHRGKWTYVANSPAGADSVGAQVDEVFASIKRQLVALKVPLDTVVRVDVQFDAALEPSAVQAAEIRLCGHWMVPKPTYHSVQLPCRLPGSELMRAQVIAIEGSKRELWSAPWVRPYALDYTGAIRVDDTVIVAGQLPLDRHGRVGSPGDLAAQTHQVMNHMEKALKALGACFADVTKVNAFWLGEHDMQRWSTNVGIRSDYYVRPGPASTGIEVKSLAVEGALISADCLALVGAHDG